MLPPAPLYLLCRLLLRDPQYPRTRLETLLTKVSFRLAGKVDGKTRFSWANNNTIDPQSPVQGISNWYFVMDMSIFGKYLCKIECIIKKQNNKESNARKRIQQYLHRANSFMGNGKLEATSLYRA